MPGIGPGPKDRVKNSAQISMSIERRKSNRRFMPQLATRLRVMLRAAMNASGKAQSVPSSVPTKAITNVCISFERMSACCQTLLPRKSATMCETLERAGSRRSPTVARPARSP
ncbi:hypothetical protein D3C87_1641280 [compost metagenome]